MITLYIFPEAFGLRNVSPFSLKVEMALKYLNMDYELREEADPRKTPKGKIPYVEVDGQKIPDSELIFEYLDQISNGGLYARLSDSERGQGTAFVRLGEDHLYWMMVASRWLDESWWPNIVNGFFGSIPALVRPIVTSMARKQVIKTYDLHGLDRHTLEEQKGFARRDLTAINQVVAEGKYIVGSRLTVFDFSVASLLSGIFDNKPETWLTEIANEFPALPDYAERIQKEVGIFGRQE